MGHGIRAIIGKNNAVKNIADFWHYADVIELQQDYSMIFMENKLFNDITELYDEKNNLDCCGLVFFTTSVFHFS